jgi:hypothetical protein
MIIYKKSNNNSVGFKVDKKIPSVNDYKCPKYEDVIPESTTESDWIYFNEKHSRQFIESLVQKLHSTVRCYTVFENMNCITWKFYELSAEHKIYFNPETFLNVLSGILTDSAVHTVKFAYYKRSNIVKISTNTTTYGYIMAIIK